MLLLVVSWIIAILFSEVSPSAVYINYNLSKNSAARIVSNTSRYTSITPVLKKLLWLPVGHHSLFKTVTLVYKFLHTGILLHIFVYCSAYNTRRSQSGRNFLVVPSSIFMIISLSNNLVIALLSMLPLFAYPP